MMGFFKISLDNLNLFSFVLGVLWCLFESYGWYGKRNMWIIVVCYFAGLALYFYLISIGLGATKH